MAGASSLFHVAIKQNTKKYKYSFSALFFIKFVLNVTALLDVIKLLKYKFNFVFKHFVTMVSKQVSRLYFAVPAPVAEGNMTTTTVLAYLDFELPEGVVDAVIVDFVADEMSLEYYNRQVC